MPNKLTDAEIKKALECCAQCKECCETEECQYYMDNGNICDNISLATDALDLINCLGGMNEKNENIIRIADKTIATLNAENESLKAEVERLKTNLNVELENFATEYDNKIKAEAYKEFAERLREKTKWLFSSVSINNEIDNLLNELVGDGDGKRKD